MSNYYVHRSGEDDYLEHAGGWKWSKPTKYIDKIMRNGRWVYVYARDKANSVGAGVKRSINRFNRATGLAYKRNAQIAKNSWRTADSKGDRAGAGRYKNRAKRFENLYNKSLLGRAESALGTARSAMSKAAGQARSAGKSFTGAITKGAHRVGARATKARGAFENATGISALRGMQRNKQTYKDASSRSGAAYRGIASKAKSNAQKYEKAYRNSLLGKAEARVDRFGDWANEQIGKVTKRKKKKTK